MHAQCSVARGPTPGTVGHSVTVTRHEPWAHGSSIPIAMRCVVVMALARPGETPKHEHAQQAQHNETPDPPAMGRPARTSYFGTVDRRALGRWRGGGVVDGVPRGGRGRGLGFGIVTFEIGDGGTDESDRLFLAPDAHTRGASVTDHRRAVILVEMVVLARHVCGRLGVFLGDVPPRPSLSLSLCQMRSGRARSVAALLYLTARQSIARDSTPSAAAEAPPPKLWWQYMRTRSGRCFVHPILFFPYALFRRVKKSIAFLFFNKEK